MYTWVMHTCTNIQMIMSSDRKFTSSCCQISELVVPHKSSQRETLWFVEYWRAHIWLGMNQGLSQVVKELMTEWRGERSWKAKEISPCKHLGWKECICVWGTESQWDKEWRGRWFYGLACSSELAWEFRLCSWTKEKLWIRCEARCWCGEISNGERSLWGHNKDG